MQPFEYPLANETSIVPRPRLLDLFQASPRHSIVLIAAPAGYGKSTLAGQIIQARSSASHYLNLTEEHNSPDRLLGDLFLAFGVRVDSSPNLESLMALITRKVTESQADTLILDDFHSIENREVHQLFSVLISQLPPGLQLIILSRTTPPLPLSNRRMKGDLLEISLDDLSFTADEIAELLVAEDSVSLFPDGIAGLAAYSNGWIAAIRLATERMRNQRRLGRPLQISMVNAHQTLDQFIVEEILSSLPNELRTFILATAFLPHLDPDLCDHVLQTSGSSDLILRVRQRLAFVRSTDGGAATTYHALFAECVNRIAVQVNSRENRLEAHMRAAVWFEKLGKWEEALQQSIQAEDWRSVIRNLRVVCKGLRDRDLAASRLYWLRKVPVEKLLEHADLMRWYTSALMETGHITEANQELRKVLPVWAESDDPQLRAYFHSTGAFTSILQGDEGGAMRHLYSGLSYQSTENYVERLHLWAALMSQEFFNGNDIVAEQAFIQIQQCRQHLPAEQGWMFIHVNLHRSNQFAIRGDLNSAIEHYQANLNRLPAIFQHASPNIQARLSALYLEQNNLELALEMATEAANGLNTFPRQVWHTEAWLILARVYHALNDETRVLDAIDRAHRIQQHGGGLTLLMKIMATEAWIRFDDHRKTESVGGSLGIEPGDQWRIAHFGELDPRLVEIARRIRQGDSHQAVGPLEALTHDAIQSKRWSEVVQLAMWQVVAHLETGDRTRAHASLKLALLHGRPGGFVRSFYTPGYNLEPFFQSAVSSLGSKDVGYVKKLIGYDLWQTSHLSGDKVSKSPLSDREQEVLTLIAEGNANKEIGVQLYITERTVKKHVGNILQKLNATNRTLAVVRARELNLIP